MNAKNLNVSLSHGVNVYSNPTCQHFLIAGRNANVSHALLRIILSHSGTYCMA